MENVKLLILLTVLVVEMLTLPQLYNLKMVISLDSQEEN